MPASKSRLISKAFSKDGALSSTATVGVEPKLETGEVVLNTADDLPLTGNSIGDQAFVEETGRLYIWSGAGWYNIALINETPTITSAGDANYTMSYGTPINIKVDATDPEDVPLTYSYYTTDSIGNAATITNDSSQFTITPTSDLNVDATFGLLFRASDGVNVASSSTSNFTLFNQPPSLSGNDSSYVLSTVGAAMTISLSSTDPEGQAVTYTVTADSGFNAIATVSSDSSVFTVTPKSQAQAPSGGTGTLTFTASDGVKTTDGLSSFSLTFINSPVLNSKYTELLLTANGTTDNNDITDGSASNHTITVNNDAHAGTFSPYRHGGYSAYFDGTDDCLEVSGIDLSSGSERTIEFWYYKNGTSTGVEGIFAIGNPYSNSEGISLWTRNGDWELRLGQPIVYDSAADGSLVDFNWHHIAIVITTGNNAVLWIDGVLKYNSYGSATVPRSSSMPITIGSTLANVTWNGTFSQNCYIHDFMIYNTAKYNVSDNTISVPTESLSTSGTELAVCHLPYFADGSSNGHSITVNGDTSVKPFTPYDNLEYEATDHGGSVYFDQGSNLTLADNDNWDLTSSNFTIKFWVYMQQDTFPSGYIKWIDDAQTTTSTQGNWTLGVQSNRQVRLTIWDSSGTLTINTFSGTSKLIHNNRWYYVEWSGGTVKVNGETYISYTHPNTGAIGGNMVIGSGQNHQGTKEAYMKGYIADLHFVNGSTAVESSIPTAPMSSVSDTKLLIKGTDASIIDKSQSTNLQLVGNTTGSTTQVKFADTKSMYFDGTGDYITSSVVSFGNSFTAEAWIYQPVTAGTGSDADDVFGVWNNSNGQKAFILRIDGTSLVLFVSYDGTTNNISALTGGTINTNTWHHIALTWDGSNYRLFVDGTVVQTQASSTAPYSSTEQLQIGSSKSGAGGAQGVFYQGYIQDARFTSGLARYTANFTPPTAPLEG